jgi:hypothetical protein
MSATEVSNWAFFNILFAISCNLGAKKRQDNRNVENIRKTIGPIPL